MTRIVAAFLIERRRDHVAEAAPVPDASVGTAEPGEKGPDKDHGAVAIVPIDVKKGSGHRLHTQAGRSGPRILDSVKSQGTHGVAPGRTPVARVERDGSGWTLHTQMDRTRERAAWGVRRGAGEPARRSSREPKNRTADEPGRCPRGDLNPHELFTH